MTIHVMIVDDEAPIRTSLQGLFEDEGYLVSCAASGEEAMVKLRKASVACILLDIWMPGIDGLETLERIQQQHPNTVVIMMSGHATIDTAVRATRQGAYDFIEKPLSSEKVLILVRNAIEAKKLAEENQHLKRSVQSQSKHKLIGNCAAIKNIRSTIKRVAQSNAHALILGEHGTGKNIVAHMIHQQSGRSDAPLIAINLAGIATGELESELFGTGMPQIPCHVGLPKGLCEQAHGGSIFLDEISELPLNTQAKLLRMMQEKQLRHATRPQGVPVDVRMIGATVYAPEDLLAEHQLREDFYYRLNVVTIQMPPLRERMEDLPMLIEAISQEHAHDIGSEPLSFATDAIAEMAQYPWYGNIRELRNYIERCHIMMPNQTITASNMPAMDAMLSMTSNTHGKHDANAQNFHEAKEQFERDFLLSSLTKNEWNISRTAAEIGMERTHLHRKIRSFGIVQEESKP